MALNPRLLARLERQREQEKRLTRGQKEELMALLPTGRVLADEPTSRHSVIRAGGPVEAFVTAESVEELKLVFSWCETHSVDYRFWGEGAFTLIREGGLSGIIIELGSAFRDISVESSAEDCSFVSAGAATRVRDLIAFCGVEGLVAIGGLSAAQGTLAGLLCASMTPGELSLEGIAEEVTVLTREMKELTLRGSSLRFEGGRLRIPRTAAVIRVLLRLGKACADDAASGTREQAHGSEGSRDRPAYSVAFVSGCKTSAADLIFDSGLSGVRVGGARISTELASSIINESEARAKDIEILVSLVKDRVRQETGVALESTVEVVGER